MQNTKPITETKRIKIAGIQVEIVRKDIKNLHLGVYPPHGRVRVAAPLVINDEAIRLAVIDKLSWVKKKRASFMEQPRQSRREMINGESHYFRGRRYRLRVHEQPGPARVSLRGLASMDLFVRPGTASEKREEILSGWYRAQLRSLLLPLIEKWQTILGVTATAWGIKKMKTKWGSCNTASGRVWFNLELIKKPDLCLEYIVAHELTHLLERHHNTRFIELMDSHFPQWRHAKSILNNQPLGVE